MTTLWRIRLAGPADRDLFEILAYTRETFGISQAETYDALIRAAIRKLRNEGPEAIGSKPRDTIAPGLRTLHITLGGKGGRHFLAYKTTQKNTIEILRILHDASDLIRHVNG